MAILDEPLKSEKIFFESASKSARAINWLIDSTVCIALLALSWFFCDLLGYRYDGFWGVCIYLAYYFIGEYKLEGKTLGKYFTKTHAVELNGEPLSMNTAVIRTLLRAALFWSMFLIWIMFQDICMHDTWSKTAVVKD
jgi:uncharacterized RDD family membrane protein YckC